eukprot:COSAG01_NODE_58397_length_306_cov_0.985507_1_plen_33_part_10
MMIYGVQWALVRHCAEAVAAAMQYECAPDPEHG